MKKVLTKKELALAYGVHYNTFLRWLKEIPQLSVNPKRRLLSVRDIQIIYEELGNPYE